MRQAIKWILIVLFTAVTSFSGWSLAEDSIKLGTNPDSQVNIVQYSGELDKNLLQQVVNNDSSLVSYQGTTFTEVNKEYTYFLWDTLATVTSPYQTDCIIIQLKDCNYNDGVLLIYVDDSYVGEVNTNNQGSNYIYITNLKRGIHKVTLAQRQGKIHFDWVGFELKQGDITPPTTWISYTPQLVAGIGGEDTEISFFAADDMYSDVEPTGVVRTMYSINGQPWQKYNGSFSLSQGDYEFRYYSIDYNNNEEEVKTVRFKINNSIKNF